MRTILRFLNFFNPFSVNMSRWHLVVKLLVTGLIWFAIGWVIFVPKDNFFRLSASSYSFYIDGNRYSVTVDSDNGYPGDLDYYYAAEGNPFLGTSPEGGVLGLVVGTLATGSVWYPAARTSKSSEEKSSQSSQKTKNEQANEALLALLDVLSPDERQVIRER